MTEVDPAVAEGLARYLAERDRQHAAAVNTAFNTLRPYERRIVREAAVMGYVRGAIRGRARAGLGEPMEGDVPPDSEALFEVIDACIAMDDLYPYIAAAAEGRRRRVTRARMWPGERPNTANQ